ncbi:MAG: cytochrome c biogenesis protein ResB [bacterium]
MKILLKWTLILLGLLIITQGIGGFNFPYLLLCLGFLVVVSIILCFVFGRKRHFTYWFCHLGIIIILLGGTLTHFFSFRENIEVNEKDVISIPKTNYSLKLSSFKITYYEDKSPKEFRSDIVLYEKEKRVANGKIFVNHPFSFKGYKFYQMDYGISSFDLVIGFKENEFLVKNIGDEFRVGDMKIKVLDFLPDFVIIDGIAQSRSCNFNNPAIKVEISKGNKKDVSWAFLNLEYHKDFPVKFKKIIPKRYFSSIEIVKDPGAGIVFIGFFVLALGIILKWG